MILVRYNCHCHLGIDTGSEIFQSQSTTKKNYCGILLPFFSSLKRGQYYLSFTLWVLTSNFPLNSLSLSKHIGIKLSMR